MPQVFEICNPKSKHILYENNSTINALKNEKLGQKTGANNLPLIKGK